MSEGSLSQSFAVVLTLLFCMQFVWRLGTVSCRVISLTAYATVYGRWVFLVIVLHWVSMFLWLVSPKNVFHGERISRQRKAAFSTLIAFVYVFAYINLQEVNHRQKMVRVCFLAVLVLVTILIQSYPCLVNVVITTKETYVELIDIKHL